MSDPDLILKYFPGISSGQASSFNELEALYRDWNEKINVISRKDIDLLYTRHVLHSLAIARFIDFPSGCKILDAGTGGGFPGIPLAIMFPDAEFTLVDSIGKKIKVVREISGQLKITNVKAMHSRVELIPGRFDYVVSRAVTNLPDLVKWVNPLIRENQLLKKKPGIIALKGGDLKTEFGELYHSTEIIPLSWYFDEEFFASKKLVYLPIK